MFDLAAEAVGSPSGAAALFFALVIGHMLGDFPMQGEYLALGKVRSYWKSEEAPVQMGKGMWLYCLTAHSLIQAGIVWLISGSLVLGIAELVLHWLTDLAKGEGWFNFATDQVLHLVAKIVFVSLICTGAIAVG